MELLALAMISSVFIASAFMTAILSSKIKSTTSNEVEEHERLSNNTITSIGNGYAYTVDLGDSMVVVVVVDKKNPSLGFLSAQPLPIEILGVKHVEPDDNR